MGEKFRRHFPEPTAKNGSRFIMNAKTLNPTEL
jgi:hypothetical protein